MVAAYVEVAHELVEEQPAQALGRAGIAGEEGALDHLGQVDERKHRAVEVREVPAQDVGLLGGPGFLGVRDLDGVRTHARCQPTRPPRPGGGCSGALFRAPRVLHERDGEAVVALGATVCNAEAVIPVSVAMASNNCCVPTTLASWLVGSATPPLRTTLSTTMAPRAG